MVVRCGLDDFEDYLERKKPYGKHEGMVSEFHYVLKIKFIFMIQRNYCFLHLIFISNGLNNNSCIIAI
jgi:hypothetical protein